MNTQLTSTDLVPHGTAMVTQALAQFPALAPVSLPQFQPVANVAAYLRDRKPVADHEQELSLFITLPKTIRDEVESLMTAYRAVNGLVKARVSVQAACAKLLTRGGSLKRFRARYDLWAKSKDWVVLVNRAKAGGGWVEQREGLPTEFLDFCAKRFGQFKREDGKRQALMSIKRQWLTGRNDQGNLESIPGYGFRPKDAGARDYPKGWHYSNILRQIKTRNLLPKAAAMLLLQGTAAAHELVPMVRTDTTALRFLEKVQFDDVKTDWRVFDPATGQVMDLWLLVARDQATRMLLGFGMRPARVRDDGSQEHLKLQDMKQLCGWLLERFGLPPYLMIWKIERGTATLSEGSALALQEMLPDRIKISYSSMIGGNSPAGYFERRIGNSKGKASLESHNRLMHTIGANVAAQTGPAYGKRPADLASREKEAVEIWKLTQFLPEALRGQAEYPLLTIQQARAELRRIFDVQNRRTEHELEGFEFILEWFDQASPGPNGKGCWRPQNTAPNPLPAGAEVRQRKESPMEKAARLVAGLEWTRVSPEIITAFYEHTQRPCVVSNAGEIVFRAEGVQVVFIAPPGVVPITAGTKLLGYFHPDDPRLLHLTDGRGAIVGTWIRRDRVKDQDAVSEAIRYQASAMKAAATRAAELNAEERQQLEAMRARNTALMQSGDFIEVTEAGQLSGEVSSSVAHGLSSVPRTRAKVKDEAADLRKVEQAARDALLAD